MRILLDESLPIAVAVLVARSNRLQSLKPLVPSLLSARGEPHPCMRAAWINAVPHARCPGAPEAGVDLRVLCLRGEVGGGAAC